MTLRSALLLSLLCLLPALPARADEFRLDPVHTRVAFQISHAGFSRPVGTFAGASGWLRFDPADWMTAQVDVRIPLATLNLGDADWQAKILDRTFFDATRYPEAHFVSTRVEPLADDGGGEIRHARVFGTLDLHGVQHEIALDVHLNALKRHPLPPFRRTAGFSATATLRRSDFGMDAWKSVVGDEVTLIIEAEATHSANHDEAEHADAQ